MPRRRRSRRPTASSGGRLGDAVEVRRDRWGVPYVSASSLEDLWFAQGFVTASERLFQIELAIRAANGRLSEWFSELTVPLDRFARVIGLHRIGQAEAGRWSEASRSMVSAGSSRASTRGSTTMPAPPVEYALLGAEPDLPREPGPWAACLAYAAWGLSGNWDPSSCACISPRSWGRKPSRRCSPPMPAGTAPRSPVGSPDGSSTRCRERAVWARTLGRRGFADRERSSRCSRTIRTCSRSSRGRGSSSTCKRPATRSRGVAFPFLPGILVGVTPHHAWGITNVTGDVQDLYEERLNDEGTAARAGDAWEPLEVVREEMARSAAASPCLRRPLDSARPAPRGRDRRRLACRPRAARARLRAPMDGHRRPARTFRARRHRGRARLRHVPQRAGRALVSRTERRVRRRRRHDRVPAHGSLPGPRERATAPSRSRGGPPSMSGRAGSPSTSSRGRATPSAGTS